MSEAKKMVKRDVFVVRVVAVAVAGERWHTAVGHFDRVPTLTEFLDRLELEAADNDAINPGFTAAVAEVARREGIPVPPRGTPMTRAAYEFPDGAVTVERGHFYTLAPVKG